jgi:SNF2 family DNA or RNA helicase
VRHYPSDDEIRKLAKDKDLNAGACEKLRPRYLGPLFNMKFYRIVLDEASVIKNSSTRSKWHPYGAS